MAQAAGVGKKQLFEHALRELRDRILSGELAADSHISETAAAELLGISRTPMREAMAHLVEEGLLERTPTGRCTVRQLTRADFADAIELRGLLEGTVLRVAAERGAEPGPLARCEAIAAEIDTVLDGEDWSVGFARYAELNEAFHEALAGLSGSPVFERELMRAHRLPLASPNAFLQSHEHVQSVRQSLYRAQAQHKGMLEAVRMREGSRAEALAREHARLARDNLDYVLDENRRLAENFAGLAQITGAAAAAAPCKRAHQGRTP